MRLPKTPNNYDPHGNYAARKSFRCGGVEYEPSHRFDVQGRERLGRLLYEQRLIEKLEQVHVEQYKVVRRTGPWYDVVDSRGIRANTKAISKSEADQLCRGLIQEIQLNPI